MTVADLNSLYDYGYWANEKLFDELRKRGRVLRANASGDIARGRVEGIRGAQQGLGDAAQIVFG